MIQETYLQFETKKLAYRICILMCLHNFSSPKGLKMGSERDLTKKFG
jgi:hypothetical protein